MKKVVLILGVLGCSLLSAKVFVHTTDKIQDYEFSTQKAKQEQLLANKLKQFQNAKLSDVEIQKYKQLKSVDKLYKEDTLVIYSTKQIKDLNLTTQDIRDEIQPTELTWLDKSINYVKNLSSSMMQTTTTNSKTIENNETQTEESAIEEEKVQTQIETNATEEEKVQTQVEINATQTGVIK